MTISGYQTGPIACQAAFIADFDVSADIPMPQLVSAIDSDRTRMDVRQGMRSKYVPLRFDPATGAHQIGGHYLFDTWEDVLDYMRFTAEELEFEPGTKFWDRPFFSNIDKRAWHVVGAEEFLPPSTHHASRLERFAYGTESPGPALEAAWPAIRNAAREDGLAAVWLLDQPDERQVGLLSVSTQVEEGSAAERASRSLAALETRVSFIRLVPERLGLRPLFDRTSLNLSLWLPRSRQAGSAPSIFPTFPVHPLPTQAT